MNKTIYWLSVIFIVVVIGVPAFVVISNPQVHIGDLFKLGIDLRGGTSLIYKLRALAEEPEPGVTAEEEEEAPRREGTIDAKEIARVIMQRIDPKGLKNYVVRPIGRSQLEVVLPGRRVRVLVKAEEITAETINAQAAAEKKAAGAEIPEDRQKYLGGILLNVDLEPPLVFADIQEKIAEAVRERDPDRLRFSRMFPGVKPEDSERQFRNIRIWVAEPYSDDAKEAWSDLVNRALAEHTDLARVKRMVEKAGYLELRMLVHRIKDRDKANWDQLEADKRAGKPLESQLYRWYPVNVRRRGLAREQQKIEWQTKQRQLKAFEAVYVADENSLSIEVLVDVSDGQNITGRDLEEAKGSSDEQGRPIVLFTLRSEASERMAELTRRGNDETKPFLAIILDGVVQSAPELKSQLSRHCEISGYSGRVQERNEVVTILNSGQIEAAIHGPISERTVGPELGADNIQKARDAMIVGSALVIIFMVVYYLGAGVVAVFALVLEIVLIIMAMYWMHGTWTLPGIAGLVLTVGMSVDANVLIFERIREEKGRGGSLALAIKNGYARAFRTILDANLTTLITAAILLWVGMEELRGFAIIIILGLLMNMFTAIIITRMIFDGLLKAGILKQMRMLQFMKQPNINWMRFAHGAVAVSVILVIVGVSGYYLRGDRQLGTEFTGGTEIALTLGKPLGPDEVSAIAEVRKKVAEIKDPIFATATVQELQYETDVQEGKWGLRYLISVRAPDSEGETSADEKWPEREAAIRAALLETFADYLPTATGGTVTVKSEKITRESLLQEFIRSRGGAEETAASTGYLPPSLRAYIGCIRLVLDCEPPLATESARRKIDSTLAGEYPDIAQTKYEVNPAGPADAAGRYKSLEVRVYTGYDQQIEGKPGHQVWTTLVQNALAKPVEFAGITSFSSQIGKEAGNKALQAVFWALVGIVAYIWLRFAKAGYGIAAIAALVHDVAITVGAVVLVSQFLPDTAVGRALLVTDMKISLPMIGGFLTLIGYSLNDTIVVFDRIRENRGKFAELSIDLVNRSINQTFTRTMLTSVTTLMVIVALYWFGGEASKLHGFSFVMLFGVLVGTYSSVAVAAPILVLRRHLLKVYAWFYPLVALAVLAYWGPIKNEAFFSTSWGWIWTCAEVVWLVLAGAVLYSHIYDKRIGLLQSLRWLVKAMAAISMLILPGLIVLGIIAMNKPEWTWALLGALGCFISLPLVYVLFRVSWRSDLLEMQKHLPQRANAADK